MIYYFTRDVAFYECAKQLTISNADTAFVRDYEREILPVSPAYYRNVNGWASGNPNVCTMETVRGMEMSGFINSRIYI